MTTFGFRTSQSVAISHMNYKILLMIQGFDN
jgi:hypothetical protein